MDNQRSSQECPRAILLQGKIVELKNIKRTFATGKLKTDVLKGISLSIFDGEMVSIMAPSGMGKTTLVHIIGCLDRATSGEYFLNGSDVSSLSDRELSKVRNKMIGFIFQSFYLVDHLSAVENVLLPTVYAGINSKEKREMAVMLLSKLGLDKRISYKPSQLSGGQKQRVAVARALINDPNIIIADEPTGNLDSKNSSELFNIFEELHKEGKAIIMATHDKQVDSIANRHIYISDGKIVSDKVY